MYVSQHDGLEATVIVKRTMHRCYEDVKMCDGYRCDVYRSSSRCGTGSEAKGQVVTSSGGAVR